MSHYQYAILFLAPALGGLTEFFFHPLSKVHFNNILSFSGAYLFGVTVINLIPDAFKDGTEIMGAFILLGFFFQLLLEQLTKGVEHGHIHPLNQKGGINTYIWGIFIGLSIHALIEGIPLGTHFNISGARFPLLYGIALHKIPAAFAMVAIMRYHKVYRSSILILLMFFCMMSPLGAFIAVFLKTWHISFLNTYHSYVIAIIIGMFFHVSTTILFETGSKSHAFSFQKIIAIISGAGLSLLTMNI